MWHSQSLGLSLALWFHLLLCIPRASTKAQEITNSFTLSAASQVTCACISTTLLQPEEFVVCCCTAGKNKPGPPRIVHCGSCSVKYTGRSFSKGQFSWWLYLLYVWSQHPSAFVRRIPTATGLKFLSFTSKWTLYCWVRWPTSLPGAEGDKDVLAKQPCGALLCRGTQEQWSCSGWSSCPEFDISRASQASLPAWSADQVCCSLCSAVLSHSPRHTLKKGCFCKTREELSMLNVTLIFLQVHGWFLYPLPPKKLCLDSQDAASNTVVEMPHCTLCTGYSTENQEPADGGWRNIGSCKTQVVRGARAAHEQSHSPGDSVQPMHCPPHPVPPWGSSLIGALKSLACYMLTSQLAFLKDCI